MSGPTPDNLSLLLADCRQALFDAVKADEGASNALRYEVGRAVGLMGLAMDAVKAAPTLLSALEAFLEAFDPTALVERDHRQAGFADAARLAYAARTLATGAQS